MHLDQEDAYVQPVTCPRTSGTVSPRINPMLLLCHPSRMTDAVRAAVRRGRMRSQRHDHHMRS